MPFQCFYFAIIPSGSIRSAQVRSIGRWILPLLDIFLLTNLLTPKNYMAGLEESLNLLHSQHELPTIDGIVSLIHACRESKTLKYANRLETKICSSGLEYHNALANYAVTMFAECGCLRDTRKTFSKVSHRYESSWTALISSCFVHGEPAEAFDLYDQMKKDNVPPSSYTAVALLKGCEALNDIDHGQLIHTEIKEKGFEHVSFVSSSLIDMYAKCGSLSLAKEIFDGIHSPELESWNSLIAAYAEHGKGEEVLKCFRVMKSKGLSPDVITLTCCLKVCGEIGAIEEGREVHHNVVGCGFENLQVENALISMYAKLGLLIEAQKIFDSMSSHDEVSWTALISGYANHGDYNKALVCFRRMIANGFPCDAIILSCIVKACCAIRSANKGQEIHSEIFLKGFEEDCSVGNSLIDLYSTCDLLEDAMHVFEKLPNRTVMSWTTLIGTFTEHGCHQEALSCVKKMFLEGVVPNVITYISLLNACANIGSIKKGREIHLQLLERGLEDNPSINISLMNMYIDCKMVIDAWDTFQKMQVQDVVAWSVMIKGYGRNREGDKAIQCFEEMIKRGIKPDAITFTCLLNACRNTGQDSTAYTYFRRMREMYDVIPSVEHHVCIIDILARSGNILVAEQFLEAQCPATEGTWGALMSACKTYGDVGIGSRCFSQLCQIVPDDGTWYASMADIYVCAGKCDDAHRIEEIRKHASAWKKPGIAAVEVNNELHEFVVGNSYSEEIALKLGELNLHIKDEGHMPNLDIIARPISDANKETALCEHAEKLAIAFGLINTPQGETLRVSKNMRMCNDCHNASKVISKIEKREIILKDECCIHHFRDGICSCGDLF